MDQNYPKAIKLKILIKIINFLAFIFHGFVFLNFHGFIPE